jgi:RimJ/RimL family protein N-acetyltransferase
VIILETSRLALREMTLDDLDFMAALIGDPETMRFWTRPFTRDEAVVWIQRQRERYATIGHGLWLIVDRKSGEPRGEAGLVPQQIDGVPEQEIAYIIDRRFWRRGLATEAASAIRDWAFARGYDRVISLIREANVPSQGVAKKIGMTLWKRAMFANLEHLVFRTDRARVTA